MGLSCSKCACVVVFLFYEQQYFIVVPWHKNLANHSNFSRGGVANTRLEAKAKDTKKIRGQGQPFRGQTFSRPRTGMLEAKAKDQGHKRKCSPKKKKVLCKNFSGDLHKKKKKVFTKIFQAISTKKRFPKNFSSAPQYFNIPKNSAVLEPRTGQFSRT